MPKTFAEYQYKKKYLLQYIIITNNWNGMNVKKAVKRSEKKNVYAILVRDFNSSFNNFSLLHLSEYCLNHHFRFYICVCVVALRLYVVCMLYAY